MSKRIKLTKNFHLDEFVPKEIYDKFGMNSLWFLDPNIIKLAQGMRDYINKPMTINDWWNGGGYQLSGFRPPASKVGAPLSQHRFGRAIDVKFKDTDYDELRRNIIGNTCDYMEMGLTTIEDGTESWLHCDIRNTGYEHKIYVVPYY